MEKTKPYLTLILIQSIYTGMFLLSKTVFDGGMSTFIFVFYRQATATLFLVPFAFFIEWKKITTSLLGCILQDFWAISIWSKKTMQGKELRITISMNIHGIALTYTSASLAAATSNCLPALTFFFAFVFGMEAVKLRTSPGVAKITGIAVCIGGAATIAFYQGPQLRLLVHHHLFSTPTRHNVAHGSSFSGTWVKGVFLMLLSNCLWGLWIVLQVH
ncbi:hypothetical protein OSB04_011970 [Centaurea solstitialis]|uniref:WAT1-related protein n=1 Tax=Centaurea solstitialis TaxID=347529 RepID=A0AA38TNJ7_9ASTR|nr:hypothetical protein OSB04_011970 [Centaurea solstitialis]